MFLTNDIYYYLQFRYNDFVFFLTIRRLNRPKITVKIHVKFIVCRKRHCGVRVRSELKHWRRTRANELRRLFSGLERHVHVRDGVYTRAHAK